LIINGSCMLLCQFYLMSALFLEIAISNLCVQFSAEDSINYLLLFKLKSRKMKKRFLLSVLVLGIAICTACFASDVFPPGQFCGYPPTIGCSSSTSCPACTGTMVYPNNSRYCCGKTVPCLDTGKKCAANPE